MNTRSIGTYTYIKGVSDGGGGGGHVRGYSKVV